MNTVHDSAISTPDSTTQYISHGASCDGFDVRSALYEANAGNRIVRVDLVEGKSVRSSSSGTPRPTGSQVDVQDVRQ